MTRVRIGAAAIALTLSGAVLRKSADMTFFVTSTGSGKGGDFGGLDGADRLCQTLAAAVGAGGKTWRAYLSTQGAGAVNAKDRIGDRAVAERQGRGGSEEQCRAARRQQPQQADGADREGRRRQRQRRHAEPCTTSSRARNPTAPRSRPATTRPAATGRRAAKASAIVGHHDRTGLTRARQPTSRGTRRTAPRLQRRGLAQDRRRRPDLLLRDEVAVHGGRRRAAGLRARRADRAARAPSTPTGRRRRAASP